MTRIPVTAKACSTVDPRARTREPITFGMPFPRGSARERDAWTISLEDGTRRHAQTRSTDRWPDGSVRWLLVDVQLDTDGTDLRFFLEPASAPAPLDSRGIVVSQECDKVLIDTGAATFVLRPNGGFPFESVSMPGSPAGHTRHARLNVISGDGATCNTIVRSVEIDERGPLRASVRLTGQIESHRATFLDLQCWLDFYADLSTARIRICVTNPRGSTHAGGFWDLGDPASVFLKELSLTFTIGENNASPRVSCSPECGSDWTSAGAPFEVYQDSSGGENWNSPNHVNRDGRVPLTFRGYRLGNDVARSHGLRATPIIHVAEADSAMAVTMQHFWQNFPKAISVDSSGALTIGVFPAQYADVHEIQGGEQKTHELFAWFGSAAGTAPALEWCRAPMVACIDPDWIMSTQAVGFLTPLDERHADLIKPAVEGPDRFEAKREIVDEYGWRNFGDIYGDHEATRHSGPTVLVSHYNNQYDPVAGFAYQFFRTADPRWWKMMNELALHVIDIDVYHTVRDKWAYNHGMFWHTYHYVHADTATHRTYPKRSKTNGGGPSADHNYTTGLMLHFFLTGNEAARRTVVESAQYVIDMDDGAKTPFHWLSHGETGRASLSAPHYYGPGRAAANSLIALLNGYRLSGEMQFLDKAESLIKRVVHPEDTISDLQLDVPEERWFYTMFWQSVCHYLSYKEDSSQFDFMYDYARASLLHYARWMAANEHPYLERPEKLVYRTETWPAQDIRKSDGFYLAALHASDSGERQLFLERARYFYEYAIDTVAGFPTRTLARPVVIMLGSGFMHGWVQRNQPRELSAPITREFATRKRFVPQRARAEARARSIALCAAALLLLAGLSFLVR